MPGARAEGREGNPDQGPRRRSLFSEQPCLRTELDPSVVQETPPYNLKAFNLRISFPGDYPLKPPTVTFTTRIYHPNVDSDGQICLPIISKDNWKPYFRAYQGEAGPCLKGGADAAWGLPGLILS